MSAGRRVIAYGDAAAIVIPGPHEDRRRLAEWLVTRASDAVCDVVVGIEVVVVVWEAGRLDASTIEAWLEDIGPDPSEPAGTFPAPRARTVAVPVAFGGPDTELVCATTGVGPDELAELLMSARLEVAAVGFSPGFAYLVGVPAPLDRVARLARPRTSVPAGSVALAGGMAAVYPQATPGGWSLIGMSPMPMFDATAPPYALLAPGDEVRFVRAAGSVGGAAPPGDPVPPASRRPVAPAPIHPALVIGDPGFQSMVQDAGRQGVAGAGVPRGGPADPVAFHLANRLVGNRAGAGAVEMAVRGARWTAWRDLQIAVVGPGTSVAVDGRQVGSGHLVPVSAGQVVEVGSIGRAGTGLRAYLAAHGGLDVPTAFASRSTDALSWLGPGLLRPGDEIGLAHDALGVPADRLSLPAAALVEGGGQLDAGGAGARPGAKSAPRVLRVLAGPHLDALGPGALRQLVAGRWMVEPTSDRVGVRLRDGGGPIERRPGEIRSLGMVEGAVQVPPDGMPVVLGRDHATLGGYPVVAVVIAADRHVLGQCRPGEALSFELVDLAHAAAALHAVVALLDSGVVGRYPSVAGG